MGDEKTERERERENVTKPQLLGPLGYVHAKTNSSGLKFDRSSKAWKKSLFPVHVRPPGSQ